MCVLLLFYCGMAGRKRLIMRVSNAIKWNAAIMPRFAGTLISNQAKTASDMRKTTSYAGKIISDIIQTTSDIIFRVCNTMKAK